MGLGLGPAPERPAYSRAVADGSALRSFGETDAAQQTHLLQYLRILYRRRWLALAIFTAVIVGAVIYIWTTVPVYEARVRLEIEDAHPRVVVFRDAVAQDEDKANFQETQYKILESRTLARRTVDALQFWDNAELGGTEDASGPIRGVVDRGLGVISSLIGQVFQSSPRRSRQPDEPDESAKTTRVIDGFIARLTIEPVRRTRLVDVKFQSVDPKRAAAIVNALADTYIKQTNELKSTSSKEASDYLEQQLEAQRAKVEASQAALQRYREQTDTVSSAEREATLQQKLNELNTAVAKARTDRLQKELLYSQVQTAPSDEKAFQNLPAIMASSSFQALRSELADLERQDVQLSETLGERHPDRVKLRYTIETARTKLQSEANKLANTIRSDYQAAKEQEATFLKAIDAHKNEAQTMRREAIEYDALEREATSDRQIFESLLQRTKETGVSSELLANNIRVIDAADPPRSPIYPQKAIDLVVSTLGAAVIALCAVFFMHYMDKAIKTPDQIKEELALPCLGLVPVIKMPECEISSPLLSNGVPALFKESFRTVRTNILFAASDHMPHTLLVTSTSPHEGKTLVASNIAIGLAQTGRRVLLMDADLRRPTIHSIFNCDQEPGVSTLATGPCDPAQSAVRSSVSNLWILPAGPVPSNPAEILSSETFRALVEAAASAFDWVIIDSPPVMAVTDAVLIANVVSSVLFVVNADVTKIPIALNALEHLDAARATFVGVVLNRVKLDRNPYYYADHYRREYKSYYVTDKSA